ncbi:MAG: SulP family inorganic anion transporter [Flavobacteriaceae bacterium]|nr:SulP family inorganic anion transporter [Flavobacteriaceae bacterium]NVJ71945.1 SulP family inorganic anion transporter [Flavobacteriaceae bacterium]
MKGLFKHFKGDFFGGITAGIVALPLALAFGVSSGLGPDAGLYGAIFIGIFAAMFGGTPSQISGPTAPMTAVSLLIVSGIVGAYDGDISRALPAILTVFILSGIIQIVLGSLQLGKYIKYIPYPVVSGFMTAIGVIIIATQLLPSMGYYPKDDLVYVETFKAQAEEVLLEKILKDEAGEGYLVLEDFTETERRAALISEDEIAQEAKLLANDHSKSVYGALSILPRAIQNINYLEFVLAFMTILIIYGFKKITIAVPSTLVALLAVSSAAYFLNLNYMTIAQIPQGFPMPRLEIFTEFSFGAISPYLFTALSLALLGAIDSLLTSVVADNMTKTKHNPNKELIGQGIGNAVAGLFGGIPGAGATIRTVVNINAGGKTRLSGIIAGLLLLVVLLALGPIASKIPAAVLSGILITVGIGVMDYKGLKAIPHIPIGEIAIMVVVLLLSVFWDLVSAVGIGLVLASLIFMKKMGDATAQQTKITPVSHKEDEDHMLSKEVYVKKLEGPLFFGSTSDLQELAKKVPNEIKHIILVMDKSSYIDQTGLYALEEMIIGWEMNSIEVYLVGIQSQPRLRLERISIIPKLISKEQIFKSIEDCLAYIKALTTQKQEA